ncbi:cytochrome c oxidase subunit II [Phyllobacterium endophyticum]|uniref:cytochrome c oxidase subunit II n=1 Tax=Phyllobacterium endophyticum TaxID=1149773 RepID=UPI0011C8178D|nr:cytochrome c oxidase subunit II [Phyllobacterium endophyticum]TXR47833.1 cytochrome c oxidase subunit II [Phyllobacterium endophyticum]
MTRLRGKALLLAAVFLAGCAPYAVLEPRGQSAGSIAGLLHLFMWVCIVIWVAVVAALAYAALKRPTPAAGSPLQSAAEFEGKANWIVGSFVALTVAILAVLTLSSYLTGKTIADITGTETVTIHVTGYQWWWDVEYEDTRPDRTIYTANELHVPVGEAVKIQLDAGDVIHSIWVPSLFGKRDLIPGQHNELTFIAEKPGVYRGQCAEFCGFQHAHMGFTIVAEPRPAFDEWRREQLAQAAIPAALEQQQGRDVFLSRGCGLCHTVRGTDAGGRVAPDLTHVASRQTLAAGTLRMTMTDLARWISDPQAIKPGTKMPKADLDERELDAVVAYVGSLK